MCWLIVIRLQTGYHCEILRSKPSWQNCCKDTDNKVHDTEEYFTAVDEIVLLLLTLNI